MKRTYRTSALLAGGIFLLAGCQSEKPAPAPVTTESAQTPAETVVVDPTPPLAAPPPATPSPVVETPADPTPPAAPTPLPPPDVPTYMNLLDREFRAIPLDNEERLPQETAGKIVTYLEQLSRAGAAADLSPEQKQAIESAMETIDKRLNAALSAPSPEAYREAITDASRTFEELQRTIRP